MSERFTADDFSELASRYSPPHSLYYALGQAAEDAAALEQAQAERDTFERVGTNLQQQISAAVSTIQRLMAERDALQAALQSIANNSCCLGCQEAARVAKAALAAPKETT